MPKTALVNLSTSRITIAETPSELFKRFLGGRGLGAKFLFDRVGPGVDPLSPDNYLIFTAGPLAGTPWPASARLHVTFKSPLTEIYSYADSGGSLADTHTSYWARAGLLMACRKISGVSHSFFTGSFG